MGALGLDLDWPRVLSMLAVPFFALAEAAADQWLQMAVFTNWPPALVCRQ